MLIGRAVVLNGEGEGWCRIVRLGYHRGSKMLGALSNFLWAYTEDQVC